MEGDIEEEAVQQPWPATKGPSVSNLTASILSFLRVESWANARNSEEMISSR